MPRSRKQPMTTDHPVRFYKFVALTFLLITIVLLSFIAFMSSKRSIITVVTKAEPVDVSMAIGINTGQLNRSISGIVATTSISFAETFNPTGTREEEGISTGLITIFNISESAQPLVATTRFLTTDNVLFRTKKRVTVPARSSVDVEVYADKEGVLSDVGPVARWSIPGLNENRQKVVYGKSERAMTGGVRTVGILTQADVDQARATVETGAIEKAEEALRALYPSMTGVFATDNTAVQVDGDIGKEVVGFTIAGKVDVVGIFYEEAEMRLLTENFLQDRATDDTEIIQPSSQTPPATIVEYSAQDGTATIDVVATGEAVLNPESKQLDKLIFYGKTKDEVRRYLLSLDHVYGVEINFRPAWMHTVPHVPDHVKIVVKNVE